MRAKLKSPSKSRKASPEERSLNLTDALCPEPGSTYTCQPVSDAIRSSRPNNSQPRTSASTRSLALFQTSALVVAAAAPSPRENARQMQIKAQCRASFILLADAWIGQLVQLFSPQSPIYGARTR